MKYAVPVILIFSFFCSAVGADDSRELASLPLFKQASGMIEKRYTFAVDKKAEFYFTPDRKSFYVLWIPGGKKSLAGVKTVYTLHGHGSTAFDEFYLWHASCSQRGLAIIALQWWFGKGEGSSDYYSPQDLNRIAEQILAARNAGTGSVLLHGFSRGSANTYGVAALSRKSGRNYLGMVLSNAGGAAEDFPINRDITQGRFGENPFGDLPWALYAGAKDPNPDRDGVTAMERTKSWLEKNGARVVLFIKDTSGDHGGFHRNPANIAQALDAFEKIAPSGGK